MIWRVLICLFLSFHTVQAAEMLPGPVPARVVRVIDGDTLDVQAQVWIGQVVQTRVRLAQIDSPELNGQCEQEKHLAKQAKQAVTQYLNDQPIVLKNIHYGKYGGRVIAHVETHQGHGLSDLLIQNGLARPYGGKKRSSWCP